MRVGVAPGLHCRPERFQVLGADIDRRDVHEICAGVGPGNGAKVQGTTVQRARKARQRTHKTPRRRMRRLKLIAQSPCKDRRVIPISGHHFTEHPRRKIQCPLPRQHATRFLHHRKLHHCHESVPIAEIEHVRMRRVPCEPHCIRPEILHQHNILFTLLVREGAPPCRMILIPGDPMHNEPLPVEKDPVPVDADRPYPGDDFVVIENEELGFTFAIGLAHPRHRDERHAARDRVGLTPSPARTTH